MSWPHDDERRSTAAATTQDARQAAQLRGPVVGTGRGELGFQCRGRGCEPVAVGDGLAVRARAPASRPRPPPTTSRTASPSAATTTVAGNGPMTKPGSVTPVLGSVERGVADPAQAAVHGLALAGRPTQRPRVVGVERQVRVLAEGAEQVADDRVEDHPGEERRPCPTPSRAEAMRPRAASATGR